MFNLLTERQPYIPRKIIGSYATLEAAIEASRAMFPILHLEIDPDNQDCADMITTTGAIYMIEPAQ